jgi:antitoxin (DNA-binding transcriptional repressor) of toxin-antitoxin stability system
MRQVPLHEAEQNLAALVAEAEAGESLTILRNGTGKTRRLDGEGL